VAAYLPELTPLPAYELWAIATSSEESAQAAARIYGVPAFADPAVLIAQPDVDLVVITVKLAHHHSLFVEAIAAARWSCANVHSASILGTRPTWPNGRLVRDWET
jgi:predicted dehydrogenase